MHPERARARAKEKVEECTSARWSFLRLATQITICKERPKTYQLASSILLTSCLSSCLQTLRSCMSKR
jgi:hypothetical protein